MNSHKKSVFKTMIHGNKLVIMCVFFTAATILDMLICTILKTETATTYEHLLSRMVLCVLTIPPLSLFKYFEKLSMWAIFPMHYAACCLLSTLYVYIDGFFVDLHPNAYRDIFRSVTLMYLVFISCALIIDLARTARANKELKRIQEAPARDP